MKKYKRWSSEELQFIRENCESIKDKELAEILSEGTPAMVTVDMIRRQRRKLQIRKKRGRPPVIKKRMESDSCQEDSFLYHPNPEET